MEENLNRKCVFQHGVRAQEVGLTPNWDDVLTLMEQNRAAFEESDPTRRAAMKAEAWGLVPFECVAGNPDRAPRKPEGALWSHRAGLDIEAKYFRLLGMPTAAWIDKYIRGRERDLLLVFVQYSWTGLDPEGRDAGPGGIYRGLHLLFIRMNAPMEECMAEKWRDIGAPAAIDEEGRVVTYDPSFKDQPRLMILTPKDQLVFADPTLFFEPYEADEDNDDWLSYDDDGREKQQRSEGVVGQGSESAPKGLGSIEAAEGSAESLFEEAMRQAGVTVADLTTEGGRHRSLLTLLSTGICKTMSRSDLEAEIKAVSPDYARDPDCQRLLDDFYGKYYADVPCVLESYVRTMFSQRTAAQGAQGSAQDPQGSPGPQGSVASPAPSPRSCALSPASEPEPARKLRRDDYDHPELVRPLKRYLPDGIRQAVASVSTPDLWIPALLASLVTCGANIPQVSAMDPMNYVHPVGLLDLWIWAESGAGKSELMRIVNMLMVPMREEDAVARQARKKYRELKRSRKANQQLPPAPTLPICELALDSTPAARAERAELAEPERRILFTTSDEAGCILSSSEKFESWQMWYNAGWAEEKVDCARSSDDSQEAYVAARLACVVACQPVYRRLIASTILQGMASRLMNVVLDKEVGPLKPLKPVAKADEVAMADLVRRLRALPEQQLSLPRLRQAMKRWEEETVERAIAEGDLVMQDDGIRGRIMTSCYRLGCILTCCWGVDPTAGRKFGDSTTVIDICLLLADYLSDTFTRLFGPSVERLKQGRQRLAGMGARNGGSPTAGERLLAQLPDEFTKADILALRPDMKDGTIRTTLKRLIGNGLIEKISEKVWKRVGD